MVLVLDQELRVVDQTEAARCSLQMLLPAPDGAQPVPAAANDVAAQLLVIESGVDHRPPWSRVHLTGGLWLTLGAARLGEGRSPSPSSGRARRRGSTSLLPSPCPQRRETELVLQLAGGVDTRAAPTGSTSRSTPSRATSSRSFDKGGVRTRAALLSRALGTS